jgi:hypothetical protein
VRRPQGPLAAGVGAAIATGLVYFVLATEWTDFAPLEEARALVHQATTAHAAALPSLPARAKGPEDILLDLPCFGCHSRERFLNETRFGHRAHEAAGHCHVCHAFESHFEVIVRKEHCGSCHPP